MNGLDVRLSRLAAAQHGLVTRRQASAAGLSSRQIDRRLADGALVVVHRGVYRLPAASPTFDQTLLAACLASGGVASHRCAAWLWALRGAAEPVLELTVPSRRRPDLEGVVAHSTCQLQRAEVTVVRAIPATTAGRTLLDLGAVAPHLVEGAMEDALYRGLVTVAGLRRLLARAGERGRNGTAVLRQLVAERSDLQKPTESPLEDAIVRVLRDHGLPAPVRQHPVTVGDGRVVRIDLAYPEVRLGVEADGRRWHSGRADFSHDRDRTNLLASAGWTILRFGWDQVRGGDQLAAHVARVRNRLRFPEPKPTVAVVTAPENAKWEHGQGQAGGGVAGAASPRPGDRHLAPGHR